jgi:hypothetical protein
VLALPALVSTGLLFAHSLAFNRDLLPQRAEPSRLRKTSIGCFVVRGRAGLKLDEVVDAYHALARMGAVIDYAFHMIIAVLPNSAGWPYVQALSLGIGKKSRVLQGRFEGIAQRHQSSRRDAGCCRIRARHGLAGNDQFQNGLLLRARGDIQDRRHLGKLRKLLVGRLWRSTLSGQGRAQRPESDPPIHVEITCVFYISWFVPALQPTSALATHDGQGRGRRGSNLYMGPPRFQSATTCTKPSTAPT